MPAKTVILALTSQQQKDLCNAIAAYGEILKAAAYGCEIPAKFEALKLETPEQLGARADGLRLIYKMVAAAGNTAE